MIAAIYARSSTAAFCCLLALATAVSADGASVIWVHSVFRSKGIVLRGEMVPSG